MLSKTARIIERPSAKENGHSIIFLQHFNPGDVILDCVPAWGGMIGMICCPINGETWTFSYRFHKIVNKNPLTISPSFVCPDGCHFWIEEGKVRLA